MHTFERYEIKYQLTIIQYQQLLKIMKNKMQLDKYGKTLIQNIYFDTNTYQLIRHSLEKPVYKEKLRVRRYNDSDNVFVELKKKYKGVVYKRRVILTMQEAFAWLVERKEMITSQIAKEIDYCFDYYPSLQPQMYLSYEREAYFDLTGTDLRITFDENIIARTNNIIFGNNEGKKLLGEGLVLMEVKCSRGMPMWLVQFLNSEQIYKQSFSKYGKAYEELVLKGEQYGQFI